MAVLSITYPHLTENLSQYFAHATAKRKTPARGQGQDRLEFLQNEQFGVVSFTL
jgi:hypothetical protein